MSHYRPFEPLLPPGALVKGPAVAVAPHPDDEVLGCGGVLAAHRAAGADVHVVVLTDGAQGDPGGDGGSGYVALRRAEARRAAEALGGLEVHFLEHPDGGLRWRDGAVAELVEILSAVRPATVLCPSPYEIHPDHRAACLLVLRAVAAAPAPGRVLLYQVGAFMPTNLLVDVTAVMPMKEEALRAYESQARHNDVVGKMRALHRACTVNVDDPAVEYAEAYVSLDPAAAGEFLAAVERVLVLTDGMAPG